MVGSTKEELMRESVAVEFLDDATGWKNTAFNITIPEGYALEIHYAEMIVKCSANAVLNSIDMILSDDPDETGAVGHTEEKVIASTFYTIDFALTTTGAMITRTENRTKHECFRTILVVNPNFHVNQAADAGATITYFCRIWFDFTKVSPTKILELLRQQQY